MSTNRRHTPTKSRAKASPAPKPICETVSAPPSGLVSWASEMRRNPWPCDCDQPHVYPDADLISLCAEFMALDAPMRRYDETGDHRIAGQIVALSNAWDAIIPRITAISAKSDHGKKAKCEVAFWVMRTADEVESEERNALVRSALADVVGSVLP